MNSRVNIIISGRVQGVWFRASTKQKADQLGITGWVRNNSNGCVEAVFEGDEETIQEMLEWCHQGPTYAKVKDVKVTKSTPTNDFEGFSIRY